MRPSRFPILTFTLVGVLLHFISDGVVWALMRQSRGPHRDFTGILAEAWNWTGPGLFLLAIALCFLLTSGQATPAWTKRTWPRAAAVFYLFHIPLIMLPLPPDALFGRWSFTVYLFLGSVGTVCAMRALLGSFHVAALFLLAEPVVRSVLWGHLHGTRSMVMAVFAVLGFPLIGWWYRDARANHTPRPTLGAGA